MSDYTQTPNYNLYKPLPNADNDVWGDHLNTNADTLDALIKTVENKAGVVSFNTRAGAVTLTAADITGAGGALLDSPVFTGDPQAPTPVNPASISTKDYVDTTASTHSTMALDYSFQTATTAPPNSGYVRLNNVTQSAATTMWIHKTGAAGKDESLYLALLTQGSTVILQDRDDSTRVQVYTLSGPLVDSGAYDTVPVVWKSGNLPLLAQRILVTLAVGAAGGGVTVGDTAPASPADGSMWFDSIGLQLYLRYNDGNSAQWVPTINQINGGAPLNSPAFTGNPTSVTPPVGDADTSISTTAFVAAAVAPLTNNAGRNLVMNGQFNVAQRGAGPFTAVGGYTLDRWQLVFNGDTDNVTSQPFTDAARAQVGDEAANVYLFNQCVGAAGTGNYSIVQQPIEGVRRLAGKTVTVSFWAVTGSGTSKLGVGMAQDFGSGGSPSAAGNLTGQAVTLNTVWARYSVAFSVPSASGKTLGTNGNDRTTLQFWFSAGASYATASGTVGTQTANIGIWGVQLEIGSVATPLDYGGTPQQQLAACQRFYQTGYVTLAGYNNAGNGMNYVVPFKVTMRAGATTTTSNVSATNFGSTYVDGTRPDTLVVGGVVTSTGAMGWTFNYTASADL